MLPDGPLDQLEPLCASEIRAAALTFPIHASLGIDNFAPRALSRLSEDALRALAAILLASERTRRWAAALDLVLII